jgi:hypothetical protein
MLISELLSSVVVMVILIGSAALGLALRPHLPERHREHDSLDLVRLIVSMLVTFAALVIGMLVASVKSSYDSAQHDLAAYAAELSHLDQCLRDYGPDVDPLRALLRSYTAGMIASTWPEEPPPTGVPYPDVDNLPRTGPAPLLGDLLNQIGVALHPLQVGDTAKSKIADYCSAEFSIVMHVRASLNEDAHSAISTPFYWLLVGWLAIVFLNFGLLSPRNGLVFVSIILCALALSSAMFTIDDLDHPYAGAFYVSSAQMRRAMETMKAP